MITILRIGTAASFITLFTLYEIAAQTKASPLDAYVRQGLEQNLSLLQKNNLEKKSEISVKEAKSLFLPEVSFQSTYQTGKGGRNINFPLGDLLNPIHNSLNELTNGNSFQNVKNEEIYFFPTNFLDTRIRTSVPIFNTDLSYNKRIQSQQLELQGLDVEVFKRELTKDIKVSYYNFLSAKEVLNIYRSALIRAKENKRVNEKLIQNGKGLKAYVLRAESDVEQNEAKITEALTQLENARLYFNFLLNRPSSDTIITSIDLNAALSDAEKLIITEATAAKREEIQALNTAFKLNSTNLKLQERQWLPKLSGFVDVGSQAEEFKFTSKSNYYFTGVQLDIPIFKGGRNAYQIKKAQLDVKNAKVNLDLITKQLNLSAESAKNSYESVARNVQYLHKQLLAAESYQKLIEKGYKEGLNSFIEDLDARNQLTSAQLAVKINQFQLLIAAANFEREIAADTMNP